MTGLRRFLTTAVRDGKPFTHQDFGTAVCAPSQVRDNAAREVDGGSACGPMVWALAKELVQYILDCREDAVPVVEGFMDFRVREGSGSRGEEDPGLVFRRMWAKEYDGLKTRETVKKLVVRERRMRLVRWGTVDWFEVRRLMKLEGERE